MYILRCNKFGAGVNYYNQFKIQYEIIPHAVCKLRINKAKKNKIMEWNGDKTVNENKALKKMVEMGHLNKALNGLLWMFRVICSVEHQTHKKKRSVQNLGEFTTKTFLSAHWMFHKITSSDIRRMPKKTIIVLSLFNTTLAHLPIWLKAFVIIARRNDQKKSNLHETYGWKIIIFYAFTIHNGKKK